jgi:3-phosphoglycerate kinase
MKNLTLRGKRILVRVDFNVPLDFARDKPFGSVVDDFRIRAHIPTIKSLLKDRNKVVIVTHLQIDDKIPHLDSVHKKLEKLLGRNVRFVRGKIEKAHSYNDSVILLDNVRLDKGEQKNNVLYAKKLSSWGDFYINDAFSASHRKHASVVGIPNFLPSGMGSLMEREVSELSRAFKPLHPFLVVLGGKKFSTKEPLVDRFLKTADTIFIGGSLANTFLSQRGIRPGKSSIEKEKLPKNILMHEKIMLPEDVIVLRGKKKVPAELNEISSTDYVYDAGPKTVKKLAKFAKEAKFIVWNGTLGFCERGFTEGTQKFGKSLSNSKAYRIAGGGDTVAAIRQLKLERNFDFISTGGGAMLEFLAKGTLPGIDALKK